MGTGFERSPGPGDEDLVVVDDDFRHEDPEVSAPQFGIGAGDFGPKALTEPLDRGIVDPPRLATDLFREAAFGFGERGDRCSCLGQLRGEHRLARAHDLLGDEVEQAAQPCLRGDTLAPHPIVILAAPFFGLIGPVQHIGKQNAKSCGRQHALQQPVENDLVERFLADWLAATPLGTRGRLRVAGVITIGTGFAAANDEARTAAGMTASCDTAQQNRRVGRARRANTRRRLCANGRDLGHQIRLDDLRARYQHRVAIAGGQSLGIGWAMQIGTGVVLTRKDASDVTVVEPPSPQSIAVAIEMGSNRARAHWLAVQAVLREVEDQPDDAGFIFADEELLTLLAIEHPNRARFIAERNRATVPITTDGVAAPVARGENRGVVRIFLVHHGEHRPHHFAVRIIAEIFGQAEQADTSFGQPVFRYDLGQQPPGEATQCIDDHHMHRAIRCGRLRDHPVELLALELAPRDVQFFEDRDELDTLALGMRADRGALRCDAGILATLFIDADTDVAIGAKEGFHLVFSFLRG